MSTARLIVWAAVMTMCAGAQQVMQEDFDGVALSPYWQPFPNGGAIGVYGGRVHLTCPPPPQAGLVAPPFLRVLPNIGTIPSPIWIVEARIAWPGLVQTPPFAASPNPEPQTLPCPFPYTTATASSIYLQPVFNSPNGPASLYAKVGATLTLLPPVDGSLHTFRWVSDGITVSFSVDSLLSLSAPYDGKNPNNFWMGNACVAASQTGGTPIEVDKIRVEWGQIVDAPPTASIGTAINYHLAMPPGSSYLLDVSTTGTFPGTLYGPANLLIPLNPPFLNTDFGALFPGVFVGFNGLAGADGLATTTVNLPSEAILIGVALSASYVLLDSQTPGGVSAVAQAATTVIGP